MEEWIEIEGKNKEEALERACNALNTNRSHMKYEIMEEGHRTKIRARKVDEEVVGEEIESDETRTMVDSGEVIEEAPLVPDLGEKAKNLLVELLHFVDDGATVELKETGDQVFLEIFAENAAV